MDDGLSDEIYAMQVKEEKTEAKMEEIEPKPKAEPKAEPAVCSMKLCNEMTENLMNQDKASESLERDHN